MAKNTFTKILIWGIVIVYVIWPLDAMPGIPIDDIIVSIVGYLLQKN